jgi:type IV secretion system protein VirB5
MRKEATMRKVLLAGVVVLVTTGTAGAQIPVTDAASLAQQIQQVAQLTQQLSMLQQQLAQARQLYGSLSRLTDINGLAGSLTAGAIRSPLPSNAYDAGMLLSGTGSPSSLGALGGMVSGALGRTQVFAPSGTDFHSTELVRNAQSIAGSLGMAQRLYQAAVDRLPGLQELQARLSTAQDPKETMDLQARIGAEQAFIATQQQQAQAVMMWQAAEERSTEQRRREEMRRDLEATSDALLR